MFFVLNTSKQKHLQDVSKTKNKINKKKTQRTSACVVYIPSITILYSFSWKIYPQTMTICAKKYQIVNINT